MEPSELRSLQLAAAFLVLPRAASDDIVGAVCAQRWASVPDSRVCDALGCHGDPDSLYASAEKRYAAAVEPLMEDVLHRIPAAAGWDASGESPGWGGQSYKEGQGGFLAYYGDATSKLVEGVQSFGLYLDLVRSWEPDGNSWLGGYDIDCDGEYDEDVGDFDAKEAGLRDEARELARAAPTLSTTQRAEEIVDALKALPELRTRAVDARAAAAAASAPVVQDAPPAPPMGDGPDVAAFDAEGVSAGDHAKYVGFALAHRVRGLPLGRSWPALELVGAPLAALAGFTRAGEPGSLDALRGLSHPRTVLHLFAAAGAHDVLAWAWDDVVSPEDAPIPAHQLREATRIAAAGGHADTVRFLVTRGGGDVGGRGGATLSDSVISAALRNAHTGVVAAALAQELSSKLASEATVRARWSSLVTAALGCSPGSQRFRSDCRIEAFTASADCSLGDLPARLAAADETLVQWAEQQGLPLGDAAACRLAAAGSLKALKGLPRRILAAAARSVELANSAVGGGGATLTWLASLPTPAVMDATTIDAAARLLRGAHPDCAVESLRVLLAPSSGVPLDDDATVQEGIVLQVAAFALSRYDNVAVELLTLLRSKGAALPPKLLTSSPKVAAWALSAGCPLGSTGRQKRLLRTVLREAPSTTVAAKVKLLLDAGCKLPSDATAIALEACLGCWRQQKQLQGSEAVVAMLLKRRRAQTADAQAAVSLEDVARLGDPVRRQALMTLLAAAGWRWSPRATQRFVADLAATRAEFAPESPAPARQLHFTTRITLLREQGAVLDAGVAAAAACQLLYGHDVLRALHALTPTVPWDDAVISAWNLAAWQVAVNGGCPWSSRLHIGGSRRRGWGSLGLRLGLALHPPPPAAALLQARRRRGASEARARGEGACTHHGVLPALPFAPTRLPQPTCVQQATALSWRWSAHNHWVSQTPRFHQFTASEKRDRLKRATFVSTSVLPFVLSQRAAPPWRACRPRRSSSWRTSSSPWTAAASSPRARRSIISSTARPLGEGGGLSSSCATASRRG